MEIFKLFFFMIKCPRIVRNNLKFKSPQDPDKKNSFSIVCNPGCNRVIWPVLQNFGPNAGGWRWPPAHATRATCATRSPLAGQVCEARITSFGVRFESRFFLCTCFFVIYFFGYIILFLGGKKYLLNNYYLFIWFN